ncbi:hypothetical protein Q7A53_05670 [Halobacillus rhizosphaerae]|uniref:hypothetical protein n=1 Tax=Halobacillus rhizosphaerae TaxID=3064889 RepID=UPI00398BA0F8
MLEKQVKKYISSVKHNWKKIDERKAIVNSLSKVTGLKKIYFETLTDKELQVYVDQYHDQIQ